MRGAMRLTMPLLAVIVLTVAAGTSWCQFPLVIKNDLDFARVQEPVSSGFPIPRWLLVLKPELDFHIRDAGGNAVPSQVKILSRWNAPRDDVWAGAKWVLISFLADVPANGEATYYIYAGPASQGGMTRFSDPTRLVVNTGAATFVVDRTSFSLLKNVQIGGQQVMSGAGSFDMRNHLGLPAGANVTSAVFEEKGGTRTVVRQKGNIPSMGLDFVTRMYFYENQTSVTVDFRLENNGNYGELPYLGSTPEHAYFEDVKFTLKASGSTTVMTTNGQRTPGSGSYHLDQDFGGPVNGDWPAGFAFTEKIGAQQVGAGNRYEGALALNGSAGSVAAAVDRFWENYPKAFETSNDELSVALWPAFGSGPQTSGQYGLPGDTPTNPLTNSCYVLEGGRWKTHRMVLDFKPSGQSFTATELHHLAARTNRPLMFTPGTQAKGYPFKIFAFGDLLMERRNWTDVPRQRFERIMDVLAHDSAADDQPVLGKIGLPGFRARGGTYTDRQMYGWENFGDIAWGDGYSSNHYDLVFGVMVNFWRTGDYEFFNVARDMAAHRRDYDQIHTNSVLSAFRGGQVYEKGFFHGNYNQPELSHTWVHGLLLAYVTTGDESYREAAIEVGEFFDNRDVENWDGWWGSRILGWPVEGLVNLYNYLGEPEYLQMAQACCQKWDSLDLNRGTPGMVPNPAWPTPHAQTWMHSIVLNAICKYWAASQDPGAIPCITRLADFLLYEAVHTLPTGPMNNRTIGKIWGRAAPEFSYYQEPSVHHVWGVTQALSWAALITNNTSYLNGATALYGSVARFHQEQANATTTRNFNDSSSFSPIAFRMMNFPNSETKIMSNIALWGQGFLVARTVFDGQW